VLVLWVGETIGGIRLDAIVLKDAKMQARVRGCGRVRLNDQSTERTLGKNQCSPLNCRRVSSEESNDVLQIYTAHVFRPQVLTCARTD
jgi:hypothetical protein